MKTLILCRHAKSDWPDGVPDIHRPLKQRGINDATYLGDILRSQALRPDLIISSPAQRARQTADIISACISYPSEVKVEDSVYYEGEEGMLRLIDGLPPLAETVMIFGHNPTMEDSVGTLLRMGNDFTMPTSGMACLESHQSSWKYFSASEPQLRWFLIPRLKRKG